MSLYFHKSKCIALLTKPDFCRPCRKICSRVATLSSRQNSLCFPCFLNFSPVFLSTKNIIFYHPYNHSLLLFQIPCAFPVRKIGLTNALFSMCRGNPVPQLLNHCCATRQSGTYCNTCTQWVTPE